MTGLAIIEPIEPRRLLSSAAGLPLDLVGRDLPSDPLFADQWYLQNTGQGRGEPGIDANVVPAWERLHPAGPSAGAGVTVAIVDNGVFGSHVDLAANYDAGLGFDYLDGDADPTPMSPFDDHGTKVAGIVGAVGDNAAGLAGVAFESTITGLRVYSDVTGQFVDDAGLAGTLSHLNGQIDVYNHSYGPRDDGRRFEAPGPLAAAALEASVQQGRGGLGNVHVWAAGNGGLGDNVNRDGYASSRYTIAVGAVDNLGQRPFYGEPGASLLVVAPSSGGTRAIATTASDDGYTLGFGGTSAAAPIVSGVVALMLEANPNLSYRDVQHILVETAVQVSPLDPSWAVNGAGRLVSHVFGFGLVDAEAAVDVASGWQPVAQESSFPTRFLLDDGQVADGGAASEYLLSTIQPGMTVEHVEIDLDIDHLERGDLEITITSPGGTVSELLRPNADVGDGVDDWTFTSVQHWGEDAGGRWLLSIRDTDGNGIGGQVNDAGIRFFGTGQPEQDRSLQRPGSAEFVPIVEAIEEASIFATLDTPTSTLAASAFADEPIAPGTIELAPTSTKLATLAMPPMKFAPAILSATS